MAGFALMSQNAHIILPYPAPTMNYAAAHVDGPNYSDAESQGLGHVIALAQAGAAELITSIINSERD